MSRTGSSTPFSSSSTLTGSSPQKDKADPLSGTFLSPNTPPGASLIASASSILESLASRQSATVFIYDTAVQAGFGNSTKEWYKSGAGAPCVEMQNRSGAGLILAGRLGQGTSAQSDKQGVLTAYTSPQGLGQMAPSLVALPGPTPAGRVVIQVPAIHTEESTLTLTPSLAALSPAISLLPENFAIILSATSKETADLGSVSYSLPNSHVVHIFDQYSAARETRRITYPSLPPVTEPNTSIETVLARTGYSLFDYTGSPEPETVIVVLKGTLGSLLQTVADKVPGLGVITVRVLRPWNAEALRKIIPQSTKSLHVIEDVIQEGAGGFLYEDVLTTVLGSRSSPIVRRHTVVPSKLVDLVTRPNQFIFFLRDIIPAASSLSLCSLPPSTLKKLVFHGVPSSTLSALPTVIANSFSSTPDVLTRLLTNFDAFSKPGGVSASRILLAKTDIDAADLPADLVAPIDGSEGTADFVALEKVGRALFGDIVEGVELGKLVAHLWPKILQVPIPTAGDAAADAVEAKPTTLKKFEFNSLELDSIQGLESGDQAVASLGTWRDAAKHILFREAFKLPSSAAVNPAEQQPCLRPDLEDRTYLITCTVNRRLTPLTYDRNVFHLEFDTSGTGLKYAIGEALGIHGWNDEQEVLDFCAWYGLDPNAVVNIPVPSANRKTDGVPLLHTRTIFQALQQQIDIFGRPPKSFYSALADHAKAKEHRLALRFIGAPEGSATFKKLSEVDTVTFADLLRKYDSARPDFATLCELVGDIKPRHYSIASSQSAVGDRVDLLVVTVDWTDPDGTPRFGQCTRYLAGLKPGQKVTASIKPSVMKLPPDNMQPIVMAGLGTGAAPFRAFIQHRAWLAAQNIPIGPLIYYFGSRHRSQEYLYGEELEAYIDAGIITHAGFAFSRDQKRKIYIQHKMLENGKMLADMLAGKGEGPADKKGVFYLCGPTWPVPDVYEALVSAFGEFAGFSREEAAQHLEDLKEEERYVLEECVLREPSSKSQIRQEYKPKEKSK
ncbi:hypothetical protein FRB99_000751 [Tulasnella sp. 403]|nr:hypothetical protein FRB99_000751 [Tulasnella sp. 403]